MSIVEIDWDLADKIYARDQDRIRAAAISKQQEMVKDWQERGMIHSGPYFSAMHRTHTETLAELADASINADCDIVTRSGYSISESTISNIIYRLNGRLTRYVSMFMRSMEQSLHRHGPSGRFMIPSLQEKSNGAKTRLIAKAKRELEIRRGLMTIGEMKKKRFQFLHKLYEMIDGDESKGVLRSQIAVELGIDEDLARKISTYLRGENLVEVLTMDGVTKITHGGMVEVEEAISKPDKATEHFPSVNIIHVNGNMIDSQIQQASPKAIQVVTIGAAERKELGGILQLLKDSIEKLQLKPQQESDLQAEIQTMESQMTSSRPKHIVIMESLNSIRQILAGAAGSLLASELLSEKIVPFLDKLF